MSQSCFFVPLQVANISSFTVEAVTTFWVSSKRLPKAFHGISTSTQIRAIQPLKSCSLRHRLVKADCKGVSSCGVESCYRSASLKVIFESTIHRTQCQAYRVSSERLLTALGQTSRSELHIFKHRMPEQVTSARNLCSCSVASGRCLRVHQILAHHRAQASPENAILSSQTKPGKIRPNIPIWRARRNNSFFAACSEEALLDTWDKVA